ncbi:MAG: VWA domain-containing protein [Deltaproteobacteria bacterium]|nr:VWA domain-containing protein [Deltaproteobacteria bacterium]
MSAPSATLARFGRLLRLAGLPVATSELLDAVTALLALDPGDRPAVEAGLEAALVRSRHDLPIFRALFQLSFLGAGETPGSAADDPEADPTGELAAFLAQAGGGAGLSPWGQALLSGRDDLLGLEARRLALQDGLAGLESPLQRGLYGVRLWDEAMASGLSADLAHLEAVWDALPEARRAALGEALARRLGRLRRFLGGEVEANLEARRLARGQGGGGALDDRPLTALSPSEIARMTHLVRRLAQLIRDRMSRQQRVRRRGRFDVQRTMRASLRYGGTPAEPIFRRRRPHRPRVVLLTDVSDSVRNVSRFFLHFVTTLQQTVLSARCFLFVSDVGEATSLFQDARVEEAVDRAFAGQVVNLHANSNYGRAFASFVDHHLPSLHPRSTVIVIGDGRNNYNPHRVDALQRIRHRVRRLIWLCPEPRMAWGFGDSEMGRYARVCDQVEVIRSFADLRRLVESVPAW